MLKYNNSIMKKISYSQIPLFEHVKKLFPICRSITGKGTRKTLEYFEKYHPEYKRIKIKSGKKVFDWEIPLEWNIEDAYIEHIDSGNRYAEFKKSNLHIVGYSIPINKVIDFKNLYPRLHSLPEQPNVIPYITSYYKPYWGFCLTENEKKDLPLGKYKVVIRSSLKKGFLDLSHAILKGETKSEIFISSYVCHPSMANNELSGPVVLNRLLDYIKLRYPNRRFTYRFTLLPETIGSIAYMSKYLKDMKKNIICGFNLTCVGDTRGYSYIQSPCGDTIADKALKAALINIENVKVYSFLHRGSDERQFCSPNADLPLCTFSRTKFLDYPEYHTSADNLDLINEEGLMGSFEIIKNIIDAFEIGLYPHVLTVGEPQLGKRGLYPHLSEKVKNKPSQNILDLIAYCNGRNSLFEIADFIKIPLKDVCKVCQLLLDNHLIKTYTKPLK